MHRTVRMLSLLVFLLPSIALAEVAPRPGPPVTGIESLKGSCGKNQLDFPYDADFIMAYERYCESVHELAMARAKAENDPRIVDYKWTAKNPFMITYDLQLANGQRGPFVLEMICQYGGHPIYADLATCEMNKAKCMETFEKFLDNTHPEGEMGKAYCVKTGTGGDWFAGNQPKEAMSGEGRVVFLGGMIDNARIVYDSMGIPGKSDAVRSIFKARKKGTMNTPT